MVGEGGGAEDRLAALGPTPVTHQSGRRGGLLTSRGRAPQLQAPPAANVRPFQRLSAPITTGEPCWSNR